MSVDPAQEMKALVDALWRNDIKTMAYTRNPPVATFYIKLHEWAADERVADWFHNFLSEEGINVELGAVHAVNLGYHYRGCGFSVTFPMPGPAVPYYDYRG